MTNQKDWLPPICEEPKHRWVQIHAHGCGAGASDQVVDEAIILQDPPSGGIGDVCSTCFQKRLEPAGQRDQNMVAVIKALRYWDNR